MWPDGTEIVEVDDERLGRLSDNPQTVVGVFDERILAAGSREVPSVAAMTVTNSKGVHLGPRFVSVTQNIQTTDVIKGRLCCLELVAPHQKRHMRCSIAVFVCCAIVVGLSFAVYFLNAVNKHHTRLDIDLPLHQYLITVVKNTTRAERISCAVAMLFVVACITVVTVYFTVIANNNSEVDVAPHEWNITREMWLSKNVNESQTTDKYAPLRLVMVENTVSGDCYTFINCAAALRNLQAYYFRDYGYDLPYNFIIGNDGRVYEARGWRVQGAHSKGYNLCSVGIAFIGDYREERHSKVTTSQLDRALLLLKYGVEMGYLHKDYLVVGAKDLKPSSSPGSNLYNAIRKWKHYDHNPRKRFANMTCDEMAAVPMEAI